ncbi:unnamed protein product [Closterium sp. NIES-64]|nr:unnamed protein product [Closterium sp. NIES-64]
MHGAIASLLLPLVTAISWRDYFVRVVPTAVATSLDITLSSFSLALVTRTFYSMWWGRRSLSCWASSSSCWPHSWRVSDGCCCKCSSRPDQPAAHVAAVSGARDGACVRHLLAAARAVVLARLLALL